MTEDCIRLECVRLAVHAALPDRSMRSVLDDAKLLADYVLAQPGEVT